MDNPKENISPMGMRKEIIFFLVCWIFFQLFKLLFIDCMKTFSLRANEQEGTPTMSRHLHVQSQMSHIEESLIDNVPSAHIEGGQTDHASSFEESNLQPPAYDSLMSEISEAEYNVSVSREN